MSTEENEAQKKTRSECTEQALKDGDEVLFTECPCCKQLLAVYISREKNPEPVDKRSVN